MYHTLVYYKYINRYIHITSVFLGVRRQRNIIFRCSSNIRSDANICLVWELFIIRAAVFVRVAGR